MVRMPLLGHAGGWDELLIAVGAVVVIAVPRMIAERRRRKREEAEGGEGPEHAPDTPGDPAEARRP